ncbi:MAG: hypothetical protein HC922_10285, partial [Leptolyngbyaceae cyanobacterium SM2_3_12]|nr:hypothetical protein [Leptolyngbyaceae cyanobacterium SM2_3_12]
MPPGWCPPLASTPNNSSLNKETTPEKGTTPPSSSRYDPLEDLRQQLSASSLAPRPAVSTIPDLGSAPTLSLGQRLLKAWPIWSLGTLVVLGGVGIFSAISLFRIPSLPNCRAIFWLTASATTRFQCAEAYADQGTVEGYLDAISLLESLPENHPLGDEISLRTRSLV